jgi:uncharacterized protein DUF1800
MSLSARNLGVATLIVAAALASQFALGGRKDKPAGTSARTVDESKRAVHALNRLAFGPRPGEAERVAAMGVDKWIDLQLHPEKLDDPALEARLAPFRTLRMDTREIRATPPSVPSMRRNSSATKTTRNAKQKRARARARLILRIPPGAETA